MRASFEFKDLILGIFYTHGQVLSHLSEWKDHQTLCARLDESSEQDWKLDNFNHLIQSSSQSNAQEVPYDDLENLSEELALPGEVENFLWDFPLYRKFVEAEVQEDIKLSSEWIDEVYRFGKSWSLWVSRRLELDSDQNEKLSGLWTKFRSSALKKIGSMPLRSV